MTTHHDEQKSIGDMTRQEIVEEALWAFMEIDNLKMYLERAETKAANMEEWKDILESKLRTDSTANAELLTLASGDVLMPDASNNAKLIQSHIWELSKELDGIKDYLRKLPWWKRLLLRPVL